MQVAGGPSQKTGCGLTDMVMKGNVSGEKEYVDNVFHLRFAHMSIRLVV